MAGRDLNIATTTRSNSNAQGSITNVSRIAGLYVKAPSGGTLVASAGRDLNLSGAQIGNASTGGQTVVAATRDLNLGTVNASSSQSLAWDGKNWRRDSTQQEVGSSIQTNGDLRLSAGNDLNARGASVTSEQGALVATAGNNVNLSAAQTTRDVDEAHQFKGSSSWFSKKTITTRNTLSETTTQGTTFSGNTTYVQAGNDINVKGSNVVSTEGTTLIAKHDVNIEAATDSTTERHFREEKKSGLFSSGGIGFTIGTQQQSQDNQDARTTAAASTVGSTNGNVAIGAGNHYQQVGSNVVAPQGDITIQAKKVDILEAQETTHSTQETQFKQSGLTVAVTAPVIAAIQTAQQMGRAAGQTSDGRMKVLAGATTALAGKNAADAVASDPKSGGGVSISITVGGSKSQSKTTQDATQAAGSKVAAGGNVSIQATGAGQDSTLTVQGSDIKGGGDVSLKADGDLNLLAARNASEMHRSSSSVGGGVGVAVSLNSNGAAFGVTANASASRGKGEGSDVSWTNTHVSAGNMLTLESGGNTNLKGAVASGKQVVANVGGDLNIESLQDTSKYHSKDQSISGSVTVGYGFSGSASASQQKIDSDFASVTEQSGIKAGDRGFQVNVHGNTDLKGAVIASTDKAVQDGVNSLTTATLTQSEIHNRAEYSASSIGMSLSGGKDVKGGRISPTGAGVGQDSGSASSTTTSGIAGNTAVRTGDAETGIAKIFDADKVQKEINAQMQITLAFSQQAGQAVSNYVEKNRSELVAQMKKATTEEERSAVQGKLDDLKLQERVMNILVGAVTGAGTAAVTKEALSTAADEMRTLMIQDSAKFAGVTDGTTTYANLSAESAGVRGDGYKVGGTRWDLDGLCGEDNRRCKVMEDENRKPILDANGKTQLALNDKGQVQFDPDAAGVKSIVLYITLASFLSAPSWNPLK
ncbi:hemagglutinin repeat-containing protein [Ralstonia solanacearum]|uniref:hemagglutinin repeat-containing protein n=1 Tax=Ralstonia solanacearum TaxID=305 RepID=UPI003CC651F4